MTKRGNILKRFHDLCHWIRKELSVQEAILDGEVVALWLNGRDLRKLPLIRRKRALTQILSQHE